MTTRFLAALDIGGTKIAATVANADGPLVRVTAPTPKSGTPYAVPDQAVALIEQACAKAGLDPAQIDAVGVSSCGPFAIDQGGIALVTPNICGGLSATPNADLPNDWRAIPLEAGLRRRFAHVVIENDCVTALCGERAFGAAQNEPHCLYVTWSTGVGFGLCVDGHVLRGKNGNAGHAGHMLLSERTDALCGCGNRGDIEGLVSGRNLGNRYGKSSADLFNAAQAGDEKALAIARDAAQWFGRALYNLTAILDLRVLLAGGSVWAHHGAWLRPLVLEEITSRLPALTQGVVLRDAALGGLVADVGAFSLVMPEEWIIRWRKTSPWQALAH